MRTEIDRLDELLLKIGSDTGGSYAELIDVAADMVGAYRKSVTPQIVRTVADLEALDKDGVVLSPHRDDLTVVREFLEEISYDEDYADDLPAVVVVDGGDMRSRRSVVESLD